MSNLFSTKETKQIELIILLFELNGWATIKDLSKKLKLSEKTISTYISEIQEIYKDHIQFEISKQGIRAEFHKNVGLFTVQREFMKRSFTYNIIDYTFFHPNTYPDDLTKVLGKSVSTIYRSIQNINQVVADDYQIKMKYKPTVILGEEYNIQNFYVNFFLEKNNPLNWPFADINEGYIAALIEKIMDFFNYPIDFSTFRYLKYAVAISAIRYQQGYRIIVEDYSKDIVYLEDKFYNFHNEHYNQPAWELINSQQSDPEDEHYMYHIFAFVIQNDLEIFQSWINHYSPLQDNSSKLALKEVVEILCDKYRLEMSNFNEFYFNLYSDIRIFSRKSGILDFTVAPSQSYVESVIDHHADFHEEAKELFSTYLVKNFPETEGYEEILLYTFYKNWDNLIVQLIRLRNKCHGAVISYFDNAFAQTQSQILNHYLGSMCQFESVDLLEKSIDHLDKTPYDIIVTDFCIPKIPGKLIYNLEQVPSAEQIFDLGQILFKSCS